MFSKNKNKGFTVLELVVVISIIGILAIVIMASTKGKETATKIQATANEVAMIYKACQDWRLLKGQANFTGISLAELVNNNLWQNKPNPIGTNYTIAVSPTDTTKVRITIPVGSLTTNQQNQLVSVLQARGFNSATLSGGSVIVEQ